MADSRLHRQAARGLPAIKPMSVAMTTSDDRACLFRPKFFGDLQRIDVQVIPSGDLVAGLTQVPMIVAAERYIEHIAHFQA